MTDRLREQMNQAGEYPPNWIPEPGDMLVGELVNVTFAEAGEYGRRPIVHIRAEDDVTAIPSGGNRSKKYDAGTIVGVWCLHQALLSQVDRAQMKLGDRVAIKRLDDRVSKKTDRTYRDFVVKVDRPAGSNVDVSEFLADATPDELDAGSYGDDNPPF